MGLTQLLPAAVLLLLLASPSLADQSFTTHNGQIFTPGFVVMNSPQPWTPMGGDSLHFSFDVTAKGQLPLLLEEDSPSLINNITIFLSSYDTGRNFTISNGTAGRDDASLGDIMDQEPGSNVKHINWIWPDCLVGDGEPQDGRPSDRGTYNISIRQNFRINDSNHYTIFDLPIAVTNSIEHDDSRPSCDDLANELLSPDEIDAASANEIGILFAPDDSTQVDYDDAATRPEGGDGDDEGEGLDGQRPEGTPEDGLGGGSAMLGFSWMLVIAGAALGMGVL